MPGISFTVLSLSPEDTNLSVASLLWDLAGATEQTYVDFITAAADRDRLRILAEEAFRTKPFGGMSDARGPDILLLIGWPGYASTRDEFGRRPELARLLDRPERDEALRDGRRAPEWRALIGDVRVILAPEPAAPQVLTGSPDYEAEVVLARLALCRSPVPATRLAALLPPNFGPFANPSELDAWLDRDFVRHGLAKRVGGRWVLTPKGRVIGTRALRDDYDPAELAAWHRSVAATYAPHLSATRPYGSSALSDAMWGYSLHEFLFHFRTAVALAQRNARGRTWSRWATKFLTEVLVYDEKPSWDVVRLAASMDIRSDREHITELGRTLLTRASWRAETVFAEPNALASLLKLVERRLQDEKYLLSHDFKEVLMDLIARSVEVVEEALARRDEILKMLGETAFVHGIQPAQQALDSIRKAHPIHGKHQ